MLRNLVLLVPIVNYAVLTIASGGGKLNNYAKPKILCGRFILPSSVVALVTPSMVTCTIIIFQNELLYKSFISQKCLQVWKV